MNQITVAQSKLPACKELLPDGSLKEYPDIKSILPRARTVDGIGELSELLTDLETQPYRFVVRGVPNEPGKWGLRRKAYFSFPPTNWLCLDWDRPAPEGCPDYVDDPEGAIAFMIEREWSFLQGVGIHWQLGNSAGIKDQSEKLSFHLWVWLDEPLVKCRGWLKSVGFDPSLTDSVRVHYTANPAGVAIPRRSGLIEGVTLTGPTEDHQESEMGEGASVEDLDCPPWRVGELMAELQAVTGEHGRHDAIRAWVLKACTEGLPDITELAVEHLMSMGRDGEAARGEVERLVDGAVAKIKSGEIKASDAARVHTVFGEGEEVALSDAEAEEQRKALTGPTVLEEVMASDSPLEVLKARGISGWGTMELAELEVALEAKGVFGRKAGQIGRSGLKALARQAPVDAQVSSELVEVYDEKRKAIYCTEDGGGYKYYTHDGEKLRVASARNEVDMVCQFLSEGMPRPDALRFRERFYKDIHETRQIKQWETLALPSGVSTTLLEERSDGMFNAVVQTSFSERLGQLCKRSRDVIVPKGFEDLMDREYGMVFDVMKAALMRRFIGDKRSTVWIHCCSDWGKSFLFDIPELCLTLDNDYSGETFRGNDPAELNEKIYFFVDEADKFTKHMKKDTLPYRKLYGGQVSVTLPLRIIASANDIGDLSDYADEQLLNRIIKIQVGEGRKLKEVMAEAGYTTDTARRFYVVMLVRRLKAWLEEAPAEFNDYASKEFDEFASSKRLVGVETNEEDIRTMFYQHFIWDFVEKVGDEYKNKVDSPFIWIDNGSEREPDRRRLYIKKPDAWRKFFTETYYGDRMHSIRKTLSGVSSAVKILDATMCQTLPDGTKFKGFWVPLEDEMVDGDVFEEEVGALSGF